MCLLCILHSPPRLAMLYAGCVNLKNLFNLNFNKMMMMKMSSNVVKVCIIYSNMIVVKIAMFLAVLFFPNC